MSKVTLVFAEAPPLVHDEHAGPLALERVVVRDVPLENRLAVLVLDCLGVNLGAGVTRHGRNGEQRPSADKKYPAASPLHDHPYEP